MDPLPIDEALLMPIQTSAEHKTKLAAKLKTTSQKQAAHRRPSATTENHTPSVHVQQKERHVSSKEEDRQNNKESPRELSGEEDNRKSTSKEYKRRSTSEEDKRRSTSEEDKRRSTSEEDKRRSTSEEDKRRSTSEEYKRRSTSEEDKRRSTSEEDKRRSTSEEDKRRSTSEEDKRRSNRDEDKRRSSEKDKGQSSSNKNEIRKLSSEKNAKDGNASRNNEPREKERAQSGKSEDRIEVRGKEHDADWCSDDVTEKCRTGIQAEETRKAADHGGKVEEEEKKEKEQKNNEKELPLQKECDENLSTEEDYQMITNSSNSSMDDDVAISSRGNDDEHSNQESIKQEDVNIVDEQTATASNTMDAGHRPSKKRKVAEKGAVLTDQEQLVAKVRKYKRTIAEFQKMMPLMRITKKQMSTIRVIGRSVAAEDASEEDLELLSTIYDRCVTWRDTLDKASIMKKLHELEMIKMNKTEHRTVSMILEQRPTQHQIDRVGEMFDKYTRDQLRATWDATVRASLAKNELYPGFNHSKCAKTSSRAFRPSPFNLFICESWKNDREKLENIAENSSHEDAMAYLSDKWYKMSDKEKAKFKNTEETPDEHAEQMNMSDDNEAEEAM
jgi:hypothetical protein